MGLRNPVPLARRELVNGAGEAAWEFTVPGDTPVGAPVAFQSVHTDGGNSEASNVVEFEVHANLDLAFATWLTGGDIATGGGLGDVQASIQNLGTDVSPPVQVSWWVSADDTLDPSDLLLGEVTAGVGGIAPGATAVVPTDVAIPESQIGERHLFAVIDGANVVMETDETNNDRGSAVVIAAPLPDLIVSEVSLSEGPFGSRAVLGVGHCREPGCGRGGPPWGEPVLVPVTKRRLLVCRGYS